MALNGFQHPEIAEEMDTTRQSISTIVSRIRRQFPDIKLPPSRKMHPEQDRLAVLFRRGLDDAQIAEITGKKRGTITVWRYKFRTGQLTP